MPSPSPSTAAAAAAASAAGPEATHTHSHTTSPKYAHARSQSQPQPQSRSTPTSPRTASSGGNNGHAIRPPPPMKRQSSQSSHSSSRPGLASPAASELQLQPYAAARVKPRHHGAKVVSARNHSSARNLAKMNKQAQGHVAFDDGRRHARQRSHEADTEIRLPGSLDESIQSRPAMKRNLTAYQLPRTVSQSQVKLKKNASHGQLSRLGVAGSSRNLASMGARAPVSPGLRGKSKRPKSAEITPAEYRTLQERKGSGQKSAAASKKVGFAVGNSDESDGGYDDDEEDDTGIKQLDMEGSGLQEDEWTEESASASPHSTRQNTANNSRRTSMNIGAKEKTTNALTPSDLLVAKVSEGMQKGRSEIGMAEQKIDDNDRPREVEAGSPKTMTKTRVQPAPLPVMDPKASQQAPQTLLQEPATEPPRQQESARPPRTSAHDCAQQEAAEPAPAAVLPQSSQQQQHQPQQPTPPVQAPPLSFAPPIYQQETARGYTQLETHATAPPRSPPPPDAQQAKKHYTNPAAKRVTSQIHVPSPAAVSSVSTLDNVRTNSSSPAPSLRSSKSNLGAGDSTTDAEREMDELVSRFVASTSHPSMGSGASTALNTPKQGSGFHTPEEHQHGMPRDNRAGANFQLGPTSPGSTISNSSGTTTPAMGRSRTELRLLQEKALADLETRAEHKLGGTVAKPVLPGHVYDRRNESLKSFMSNAEQASGLSMGPQIFQGRFRAVNTELRVVQKFRDPVGEAIARLRSCKGSKLHRPSSSASVTGPGLARASTGLNMSKSAVHLPSSQRGTGALSKSASPPKMGSELALKRAGGQQNQMGIGGPTGGGSERQQSRRGVSFAGGPPRSSRGEMPGREVSLQSTPTYNGGMIGADVAKFVRELWHDL